MQKEWRRRGTCGFLVQKLEGKRPLGKPRCKWIDNMKMVLVEIGFGEFDWTGLAQDT
jgi:hypothetical protein